jgi:hypothetical protein
MDLSALLGRGLSDHLALAERTVAQVIDRLAADESMVGSDETPAERIATALGNRLARMVLDEETSAARYEELADRNVALASALGACDCWGESADCPTCDGDGSPGWLPPDPPLFATYVRPVVHRFRTTSPITTPHINNKENNDDRPLGQ